MDPTVSWGTLGAHAAAAKGARGARVGGGVTIVSLEKKHKDYKGEKTFFHRVSEV